jgi:hypothetical protein
MDEVPSNDSLKVTVTFTRREHGVAVWAAANRGPLLRRPQVKLIAAVVGGIVIYGVSTVLQHVVHPALPPAMRVVAAILGLGVVGSLLARTARLRREVERHEQHPDEYTLDDAGLEVSGAEGLAVMSWSGMTRVHETDLFFLFVAGSEVQYLPKRALEPTQVDLVRRLIARHAPSGGRRLPPPSRD